MSEEYHIVDLARGEPLPVDRVGVRMRFPLSGSPSPRWSRDLSARLTVELVEASASDAVHAVSAKGCGSWRVIFSITASSLARVKVHSNGWAIVR